MSKSTLSHYCEVSSCAGVIDAHTSKTACGKLFWVFMIGVGLGVTCFHTYMVFTDYLNGGKGNFQSTVDRIEMDRSTPFPAVTVCNFNRAMKSKLDRDNVKTQVMEYAYAGILAPYDLWMRQFREKDFWKDSQKDYDEIWQNFTNGTTVNLAKMFRTYGHDCDSIFLRVVFNGYEGNRTTMCADLMTEVVTNYGRCWRYEFTTGRSQVRPGPAGGLQLLLDPAIYEYPKGVVFNNYLEQGIVLSINYDYEPFITDPVVIEPGSHAYISVSGIMQRYIPADYPIFPLQCQKNYTFEFVNAKYTLSNCRLDCLAVASARYVGCVPILEPKGNFPTCTPEQNMDKVAYFFDGSYETYWNKHGKDIYDDYKDCEARCINPCDTSISVSTSSSISKFVTDQNRDEMEFFVKQGLSAGTSTNYSQINISQLIRADIYFPVLQYIKIDITEETPIMTFIANVGGNWGLWTGICVMSIVQAIYYFIQGAFQCCCGKPKNKITMIRPASMMHPSTHPKVIY